MTKTNKLIYFFIATVFFVIFDLYFSSIILDSVRFKITDNPIIDIIFVQNTGAAFSILENSPIFLIGFSLIAILLILVYAIKHIGKFSTFAGFWTAMLLAGISCNLYERIVFGYVRDFFKLNFVDFPVFNISDIFINLSVFALIVVIVKSKYLKH